MEALTGKRLFPEERLPGPASASCPAIRGHKAPNWGSHRVTMRAWPGKLEVLNLNPDSQPLPSNQ